MKNKRATARKINIRLKSRLDADGIFRNTLIKADTKNINAPTSAISIASKNISVNPKENTLSICFYTGSQLKELGTLVPM